MNGNRPLALLALLAISPILMAWVHGSTTSTCPYGAGGADGCNATTITATYSDLTFFTSSRQSGQVSYGANRPQWNVAGVDPGYNVGPPANQVYKNPAVDTLPSGCTYYPTGVLSYTGPLVYCTSANPTFDGWDFGLNNCTQMNFTSGVTGTITIRNSKFKDGSACTAATQWIVVGVGSNASFVFTNNLVDGNAANIVDTNVIMVLNQAGASIGSPCSITVQYNAIYNINSLPMTGRGTYCIIDIAFNYVSNWLANSANPTHGAFFGLTETANTTVNSASYRYNTILIGTASPNQTTSFSFLGTANNAHILFGDATVDHNTVVVNKYQGVGGSKSTGSALIDVLHVASVTNLTITNNYVDPTGAFQCILTTGDASNTTGTVSNGSGGSGTTLNITAGGSFGFYPGAFVGTSSTDPLGGTIAAYGTTSPDTGLATTGTGGTGTYVLLGATSQNRSFTGTFSSFDTPITGTTTVSGNTNLLDGSAITKSGRQWNLGTCNGI